MVRGTLVETFKISGLGIVVLVELEGPADRQRFELLSVGDREYEISGIDNIPRQTDTLRKGLFGIFLKGASKEELQKQLGAPISVKSLEEAGDDDVL